MNFIRRKSELPRIEIAPLVDIIFLLLIFFMLSSSFIKPMLSMDLPDASHREERLEKVDLIVTVDAEENVYVNKTAVPLDGLKNHLVDRMASLGRSDVIFSGDRAMRYELFVTILDTAKQAGAATFSVEYDTDE
ncbi:MAG: ExbD/TolR family protein [Spirochaetota bacterium]